MGVTPSEPSRYEPATPAPDDDDHDPFSVLPFDLNGELVVYVLATLVVALIVLLSDFAEGSDFVLSFTVLTFAYLLSRGIAKAGRVWER